MTLSRDSGRFSAINTPNDDIAGFSQTGRNDTNANSELANDNFGKEADVDIPNSIESNSNGNSLHGIQTESNIDSHLVSLLLFYKILFNEIKI